MGLTRAVTWAIGAVLAVAGAVVIVVWTGVVDWIPGTILGAIALILMGVIVMGMANRGGGGPTVIEDEAAETESPDVVKVE